eukprot:4789202-Alexandrium_andersonii.AAC.1
MRQEGAVVLNEPLEVMPEPCHDETHHRAVRHPRASPQLHWGGPPAGPTPQAELLLSHLRKSGGDAT